MNNIKIISDSSCDLSDDFVTESGIEIIPFYISFDQGFVKEGEGITGLQLYQKMLAQPDIFPKTSCPSTQDYTEIFERHLKEGKDIICVCISGKLSGSLNAAFTAKQICLEKYKTAKIEIIDSEMITVFQGLLVKEILRMKNAGMEIEKIAETAEKIKKEGKLFIRIEDFKYLNKGGRMDGGEKGGRKTLKLHPVVSIRDGSLFPAFTIRGKKAANKNMIEKMLEFINQTGLPKEKYSFAAGFGNDEKEFPDFKTAVLEAFALHENELLTGRIGATIAVHSGPFPLTLAAIPKAL